jgi:hypothetical protein
MKINNLVSQGGLEENLSLTQTRHTRLCQAFGRSLALLVSHVS